MCLPILLLLLLKDSCPCSAEVDVFTCVFFDHHSCMIEGRRSIKINSKGVMYEAYLFREIHNLPLPPQFFSHITTGAQKYHILPPMKMKICLVVKCPRNWAFFDIPQGTTVWFFLYQIEVERDVARLEISAWDGEMRQAHLDSSRQIELTPLSRLISSRKIEFTLCLVSSRLANLRCLISSHFTRQKRDQNQP